MAFSRDVSCPSHVLHLSSCHPAYSVPDLPVIRRMKIVNVRSTPQLFNLARVFLRLWLSCFSQSLGGDFAGFQEDSGSGKATAFKGVKALEFG